MEKNKKTTILDIAKSIKISASTVSRALNNNSKISQKTREKIWEAAKTMGYFPNLPEYMKIQKNKLVFLVDNLLNKSNDDFITKAQKELLKNNIEVSVQLISSDEDLINFIKSSEKLKLTGIASLLTDTVLTERMTQELKKKEIHLITVNQPNSEFATLSLVSDFYNGAQIATNHLRKQNAKHIVLILDDSNSHINNDIERGLSNSFTKNNGTTYQIYKTKLGTKNLMLLFDKLMNEKIAADSFICPDNLVACKLISFIKSKGKQIPKDIMVVSFGNESYVNYLTPGVTTIEYSSKNMAKFAAKQFLKLVNNEPIKNTLFIEPLKLVIRRSSTKG